MLALHVSLEPYVQQGDCPRHAGRTQHPKHDYQRYLPIPREPSPGTGSSMMIVVVVEVVVPVESQAATAIRD